MEEELLKKYSPELRKIEQAQRVAIKQQSPMKQDNEHEQRVMVMYQLSMKEVNKAKNKVEFHNGDNVEFDRNTRS